MGPPAVRGSLPAGDVDALVQGRHEYDLVRVECDRLAVRVENRRRRGIDRAVRKASERIASNLGEWIDAFDRVDTPRDRHLPVSGDQLEVRLGRRRRYDEPRVEDRLGRELHGLEAIESGGIVGVGIDLARLLVLVRLGQQDRRRLP